MLEKKASCVGFNEENLYAGLQWAFLRDFFPEVIFTIGF